MTVTLFNPQHTNANVKFPKAIFFCLLFFLACEAFAQSTTIPTNINSSAPPSSNATSLTNAIGNYSVNYYTGKVAYTAKIQEFNISKLSIPVSLNYSMAGIKVQSLMGPVGLGWNLNAGGVITREMRSLPDEASNGYCGVNNIGNKTYTAVDKTYFDNILSQTWDSEPDNFNFSFLGFSGTFKLDKDGKPIFQSSSGLKMEYCPFDRNVGRLTGGLERWVLVDLAGNRYYFGDTGGIEYSNVTFYGKDPSNNQVTTKNHNYISSWFLFNIVTADGQSIAFDYQLGNSYTFTNYINVYKAPGIVNTSSWTGSAADSWNENINTTIPVPHYLSRISSSIFKIDFIYDSSPATPRLSEVRAFQNNVLEFKYKINYANFNSNDGIQQRYAIDNIQRISPITGNGIKIFSFTYNTNINLPARNSLQTDYWGYYNSNPGSSDIQGYNGGDRTADPLRTAANLLTSVTNMHGAKTIFNYEQNTYANGTTNVPMGGLRVQSITNVVNGLNAGTEFYNYNIPGTATTSGQLYIPPNNHVLQVRYRHTQFTGVWTHDVYYHYSGSLSNLQDLAGVEVGYSYVRVAKADGSSSRYRFTNFSEYPDIVDKRVFDSYNQVQQSATSSLTTPQFPQTSYAFARGKIWSLQELDKNDNVVRETQYVYSLSNATGSIKGIKAYLQDQDKPANVPFFIYFYYNGEYEFFTRDLLLTSKTETNKFYNGTTLTGQSSLTENYTYTNYNGNNFLSSKKVFNNSSPIQTTYYRYPFNVLTSIPSSATANRPLSYLVYNNIIGQPIEEISTIVNSSNDEQITGVGLTKFSASGYGTVKPSAAYRIKTNQLLLSNYQQYSVTPGTSSETETIDPNLEQSQLFTKYDQNGNLTETKNPYTTNGQASTLWGYGLNYPIAEVKNARYNEFFYTSFEEGSIPNVVSSGGHSGSRYYWGTDYNVGWVPPNGKSYLISYWYLYGGSQWKYSGLVPYTGGSMVLTGGNGYDDIRIHPADALMTTYTYKPLVGKTSEGNNYGQTANFTFDEYQRPRTVIDMNGNIIKRFDYFIKGQ